MHVCVCACVFNTGLGKSSSSPVWFVCVRAPVTGGRGGHLGIRVQTLRHSEKQGLLDEVLTLIKAITLSLSEPNVPGLKQPLNWK